MSSPRLKLYLVIWANGQEDKFWVEDWPSLSQRIKDRADYYGTYPELIYHKQDE